MRVRPNPDAPLQPIRAAAELTGISCAALRAGCQEGTVPHVKIGGDYRIHVPALLELLEKEARASVTADALRR